MLAWDAQRMSIMASRLLISSISSHLFFVSGCYSDYMTQQYARFIAIITRRSLLCCLLLFSIAGILPFAGLYQHAHAASDYTGWDGGTEFGMQIDTHYATKIPNLMQLHLLNPVWVRGDYNPVTFAPNWPSNVKTLVLVNNETTHSQGPEQHTPFSAWQVYVDTVYVPKLEQILQQSPSIPAIEVWNEEDICHPGFCPYVPPQEYAYLLDRAATTIKAISPHTKVIMGGLASGQVQYVQDVMQADPNGFAHIDAVGLHPYGTSPDGWCATSCSGGILPFGDLATVVTNYRITAGKPVWVTEIGTGSADVDWQAQYLWRCFMVLRRLHVPVVIWYSWIDTMNPYFGLMDSQEHLKPSGALFLTFNHRYW